MKRKLIMMLMVTTALLSGLTGCGSSELENQSAETESLETDGEVEVEAVTLKVWTPENQHTNGTIESMAASFQELHPEYDITFTYEVISEDAVGGEILKDVEAAADVFFFLSPQTVELVEAGALARLGGTTVDMIQETMSDTVVGTVTNPYDGSIYGIPFTHNTYFMYYDKSLLTETDVETIEGVIEKDLGEGVTNFFLESAGGWKLASWYYGAGCTIYGEDQNDLSAGCDWNNETGVAVTNYLLDMKTNPKVAFDNEINPTELIGEHKLGAWFDGTWNYQVYKEVLGDDLGMAVLPTYELNGNTNQLKASCIL